jgi:hypothetical protein
MLAQAVSEAWPESQSLEFKAVLPVKAGNLEFAKDVAALANADGGDLVFGVASSNDCASALRPISTPAADAEKRRLTLLVEAHIEPRLQGIEMREINLTGGGYVLVLRIPASFTGPHAVVNGVLRRFVLRSGTHTSDMTYDQLRSAFDRTATLAERARQFRLGRLQAVAGGQAWRRMMPGPICAAHFTPLSAMTARGSVDVAAVHQNFSKLMMSGWGGANRSFNLDGVVVYPGRADDDQGAVGFTQVYRTGAIEFLRHGGSLTQPEAKLIFSGTVSQFFRESLQKAVEAAQSLNLAGPATFGIALLHVDGYQFQIASQSAFLQRSAADRSNIVPAEAWIDDVGSVNDIDLVARPVLDVLYQSFDVPRCQEYDPHGTWKPAL